MNLSQLLKKTHKPVKIGTRKGAAFLYIGSPENALKALSSIPVKEGSPPWADRGVTDCFIANPAVDDAIAVIIAGREHGTLWFFGDTEGGQKWGDGK